MHLVPLEMETSFVFSLVNYVFNVASSSEILKKVFNFVPILGNIMWL